MKNRSPNATIKPADILRKRLLDADDVRFLAENLNATLADARETREVFGPTLVYSRESMQWQIDHAAPHQDVKEWIDEQAASVMKWPVPILSATRVEWLPQVEADLFVLQSPSHLTAEHAAYIARLITQGHPIAIFGAPVEAADNEIARLGGLAAGNGPGEDHSTIRWAKLTDASPPPALHVPPDFRTLYRLQKNEAAKETHVVYDVGGNPVLVLNTADGKRVAMWDPPDAVFKEQAPLAEDWGGSGGAYALAAGALNSLLSGPGVLHAEQVDLDQTMNVTAWRGGNGVVHILAGNLEEGLRDDADMSRHATLVLPEGTEELELRIASGNEILKYLESEGDSNHEHQAQSNGNRETHHETQHNVGHEALQHRDRIGLVQAQKNGTFGNRTKRRVDDESQTGAGRKNKEFP